MGFQDVARMIPMTMVGEAGSALKVFDDMRAPAGALIRPGPADPTWTTDTRGVGGGVAFSALGFALNDYVDYWVETSHSMALNTTMDIHVHWDIPSNSVDDKIKFQADVIAAPLYASWAVPAGSPFSAEYTLLAASANKNNLLEIGDIPAVNTTVSTMYICRLTRIAASALDYANPVFVDFVDCHFSLDTAGSLQEGSKV